MTGSTVHIRTLLLQIVCKSSLNSKYVTFSVPTTVIETLFSMPNLSYEVDRENTTLQSLFDHTSRSQLQVLYLYEYCNVYICKRNNDGDSMEDRVNW